MDHLVRILESLRAKRARIVVGLMSGTSADAIDVAICRIEPAASRVDLIHRAEYAQDPSIRRRVDAAGRLDVRAIAELHVTIGERFAAACLQAVEAAGLAIDAIDLIGSHGQTVYHHSGVPGAIRATLQLGDGDVIAERTGRLVVSDFRARDIAAGGEGAPLSPIADVVLFGGSGATGKVILNLGGIANVTVLDDGPARVFGFDTGPANAPLDRLARILTDGALAYDRDGRLARAGRVDVATLASLMTRDDYLPRRPPKSTGFEMYGDAFVEEAARLRGGWDVDLMTTLVEFTARTIADALRRFVLPDRSIETVVAAGGGVRNPVLMERLHALLDPIAVVPSDALGVPSDTREAMAFAVLADMAVRGVPAWLPPITGARGPRVLGKFSLP